MPRVRAWSQTFSTARTRTPNGTLETQFRLDSIEPFHRRIATTPCSILNTRLGLAKDHGRMTNAIAIIGQPRSQLLVSWPLGRILIAGPSPLPWICNSPGVNSTSMITTDILVTLLQFSRHPVDRPIVLRE